MVRNGEWMTLQEAARHLGLSTRTVRRWIKDGKLHADLQPGPYGQQYLVPASSLPAARLAMQVAQEERRENLSSLSQTLERYLGEREDRLLGEVAALRREVAAVRDELAGLRDELAAVRNLLATTER